MTKRAPKKHPGGRPLTGRERKRRYLVTLEPRVAQQARDLAAGNLSAGLSVAVERATEPTPATP